MEKSSDLPRNFWSLGSLVLCVCTWETPLLWKRKRLTRGSGTRLGEGRRIRSGAGRGLGYHGNRDAQAGREPNLAANAPPILSMAPKKEKGTGSANSKIWEPSLIAAHLNQVSLPYQVSPSPGLRQLEHSLLSTALIGPYRLQITKKVLGRGGGRLTKG